ncbi:hypothetical protein HDU96_005517, partial [Phlyctochytrium bullatum]
DGDIDLVDATAAVDDADDADIDPAVFPATTTNRDPTGDLLLAVAAKAREFADAPEDSSSCQSPSRSSPPRAVAATRARAAKDRVEPDRHRQRYNQPPPLVAPVVPSPPPPPAHEPGDTQLSLLAYWGHSDDRPCSASSARSPATDSVSSIGRGLTGLSVRSPSTSGSAADPCSPERRLFRNPSPPPDTEPPAGSSSSPPPPPPPPVGLAASEPAAAPPVPAAGVRVSDTHLSPRSLTPPVRGAAAASDTSGLRRLRRSQQNSPAIPSASTRGSGFVVRPRSSLSTSASPLAGRSGASTPSGRRSTFT